MLTYGIFHWLFCDQYSEISKFVKSTFTAFPSGAACATACVNPMNMHKVSDRIMLIHLFALLIGKSSIIAIFHSKGQFSNENRPYAFMIKVHETHSPYPERMLIDGIVPSPCIKSFFSGAERMYIWFVVYRHS